MLSVLKKSFLIAISIIGLCACAVKTPNISYYVLTLPTRSTPLSTSSQTHQTLLLNPMAANPGFTTNNMIYVTNMAQLRQYSIHQWVSPPAQMLLPILAQKIEAKNYFHAVMISPSAGEADLRLDTRLLVLEQEFVTPLSQVRCAVEATLINAKNRHVIASQRFQVIVPASGNNPQSGVVAANLAAQQIADQIADFVLSSSNSR